MECIHKIEYYSAIKKNRIMPIVTTWIDLEIIIVSDYVRKRKINIIQHYLYVEF